MKEKKMTDLEIVEAFAELLNRHDGAFARGEYLRYWNMGDEGDEDEDDEEDDEANEEPASGESAMDIYLAKRTAARMIFDESGALKDIDPLDF